MWLTHTQTHTHTHTHTHNQSHNLDGKWSAMVGAGLGQCSLTSGANVVCHSFLPSVCSAPFQFALINNPEERRGAILKNCSFTLHSSKMENLILATAGYLSIHDAWMSKNRNVWVRVNYYFRISLSSTVKHLCHERTVLKGIVWVFWSLVIIWSIIHHKCITYSRWFILWYSCCFLKLRLSSRHPL